MYLADTHVLLWADAQPQRLSSEVRLILGSPENVVYASAVSAYEIAIKYRRGRLAGAAIAMANYDHWLRRLNFEHLPLTAAECVAAGSFAAEHNDPWDRILVAQALAHNLVLLSIDAMLDRFPIKRLW